MMENSTISAMMHQSTGSGNKNGSSQTIAARATVAAVKKSGSKRSRGVWYDNNRRSSIDW